MKKKALILTLAIISVNCIILSAQTGKGKFLIGELTSFKEFGTDKIGLMAIGFTSSQSKSDPDRDDNSVKNNTFSINLLPRVGYFVIDNLALGLDFVIFSSFRRTSNDAAKFNLALFSVGPFVRYYIPTKKVLPFAEINYSIGSEKLVSRTELNGEERTFKYAVKFYGLGLGVAIPLGEKVSFDALVGYQNYINKFREDETNNRIVAGTVGLKLGFTVFLGPNK